jgi:hypothetical protein
MITGYDESAQKITDESGGISLMTGKGAAAATWKFRDLLSHWIRKHGLAVYIPSQGRSQPERAYRYGHNDPVGRGH